MLETKLKLLNCIKNVPHVDLLHNYSTSWLMEGWPALVQNQYLFIVGMMGVDGKTDLCQTVTITAKIK